MTPDANGWWRIEDLDYVLKIPNFVHTYASGKDFIVKHIRGGRHPARYDNLKREFIVMESTSPWSINEISHIKPLDMMGPEEK
jgi:hypothetical protein